MASLNAPEAPQGTRPPQTEPKPRLINQVFRGLSPGCWLQEGLQKHISVVRPNRRKIAVSVCVCVRAGLNRQGINYMY